MKNPQKLTSRAWWQKEATEYHQQAILYVKVPMAHVVPFISLSFLRIITIKHCFAFAEAKVPNILSA